MANGKGEAECITCAFQLNVGGAATCQRHRFAIPTQLGPYLICVDWKHEHSGSSIGYLKFRQSMQPGILYRYDIYAPYPPMRAGSFSEFPTIDHYSSGHDD